METTDCGCVATDSAISHYIKLQNEEVYQVSVFFNKWWRNLCTLKGTSSQHVLRSVAPTCLFVFNTTVINRSVCMNSGWNIGSVFDCPSVCEVTAALLDCFVSQSHLHVSVQLSSCYFNWRWTSMQKKGKKWSHAHIYKQLCVNIHIYTRQSSRIIHKP